MNVFGYSNWYSFPDFFLYAFLIYKESISNLCSNFVFFYFTEWVVFIHYSFLVEFFRYFMYGIISFQGYCNAFFHSICIICIFFIIFPLTKDFRDFIDLKLRE